MISVRVYLRANVHQNIPVRGRKMIQSKVEVLTPNGRTRLRIAERTGCALVAVDRDERILFKRHGTFFPGQFSVSASMERGPLSHRIPLKLVEDVCMGFRLQKDLSY
jgi:hypothetical protein